MANITINFEIDKKALSDALDWFEVKLQNEASYVTSLKDEAIGSSMSLEERNTFKEFIDQLLGASMRNAKQLVLVLKQASVGTATPKGHIR